VATGGAVLATFAFGAGVPGDSEADQRHHRLLALTDRAGNDGPELSRHLALEKLAYRAIRHARRGGDTLGRVTAEGRPRVARDESNLRNF
jgi:hypothetical protein